MQSLVLGTAQWGLDYGVTNAGGRVGDHQLAELVSTARELGIHRLDTAGAYGDAESRVAQWAADFAITTKVTASGRSAENVHALVASGLRRLGVESVAGCLVHDWPGLSDLDRESAADGLQRARADGLVAQIGVSGYEAADLDSAAEAFDGLDVVQIPVSALDQRLVGTPAIERLRAAGCRIQARSVFLQGLLLAPPDGHDAGRHPDVSRFHEAAARVGVRPVVAALAFPRGLPWISEVVVGVTSAAELRQVLSAWTASAPELDWRALASSDLDLVDPRRWPAVTARGDQRQNAPT